MVKREALQTAVNGTFSSLLCMFALFTGMNIRTVYPEKIAEKTKHSQFMNGLISPRAAHTLFSSKVMQDTLVLMWSSVGIITVLPSLDASSFNPNHFVPLVEFKHGKSNATDLKSQKLPKARQQLKITDVLNSKKIRGNCF